ncbi:MAG: TrkA C-terminal domain-containing protein, partial [Alphaproteobacteria bacterium]|nr:TrkA C-terminal domain-containing protein [Alphaproteobacteria bacterium]
MEIDLYELFAGSEPLVLFVCLGIGYVLGKAQWGPIQLGAGGGVLVTAVLFGHFGYEAPGLIGTLGFIMFIYSVGFQAGPRFFSVFLSDGSKYVALAVMVSVTGFVLATVLAGTVGLDSATAAGILAGALTSTPTLIGAQSAVEAGTAALPDGMTRASALEAISVGYAITYVFGTVGLILIIRFLPQTLGLDLVQDAKTFAQERGYAADDRTVSVSQPVVRAYDVTTEEVTGIPLRQLRRALEANEVVLRVKRGEELFEGTPDFELALGDRIALLAPPDRHQQIREAFELQGEVLDPDLLDMHVDVDEVIVSRPDMVGSTLGELDFTRSWGCFLSKIRRSQIEMPIDDQTALHKGDVLTLVGERRMLDRLIERIGYAEDKVQQFDLVAFAFGIVLGLILGEIQLKVGQVNVGLGTAGGLLVSGIL